MTSARPIPNSRSALDDYPTPPIPEHPSVSLVVPVRNEIANLEKTAADILAQDYPNTVGIWFVDGLSEDGTFDALKRIQEKDGRVRVISNPKKLPAAAFNIAFREVRSDIVIRLDAHARYEPDVVAESVNALLATGAGGVGAIARPAPAETLVGRAIVAAHKSRLGVGVAKFRQENAEGWVDSVWNGCYWKHVVDAAGPLREDLWRAEDNDFNERIRRLGYGLYLSPRIKASYQVRSTFAELWKQYFANGIGNILALPENPAAIRLRHLIPMLFVLSLLLALVTFAVWQPAGLIALAILALYLTAIIAATVIAARKERGAHVMLLPLALLTLHLSYGTGSLYGVFLLMVRRLSRSLRGA